MRSITQSNYCINRTPVGCNVCEIIIRKRMEKIKMIRKNLKKFATVSAVVGLLVLNVFGVVLGAGSKRETITTGRGSTVYTTALDKNTTSYVKLHCSSAKYQTASSVSTKPYFYGRVQASPNKTSGWYSTSTTPTYTITEGTTVYMTNYVVENGEKYARVKCSNPGDYANFIVKTIADCGKY